MFILNTLYLNSNETSRAAEILSNGGLVAIPTETVYGLAADAFNEDAIEKIYIAKGRPADNPLIVHISSLEQIDDLVSRFTPVASAYVERFWPGPLTLIFPKSEKVPDCVTSGMPGVAIRFPSHPVAREIITKAKRPLVAPSANLSGSPSPTKFEHVFQDLNGKIDAIVDGGECSIGIESTVVSLLEPLPRILRPGFITPEQIENDIGMVKIDDSVYGKLKPNQKVLSPGTKYKHYSPKAKVVILKGSCEKYAQFVNSKSDNNVVALCFDEDIPNLKIPYISYGSIKDEEEQARNIFDALRECDKLNPTVIYAHNEKSEGVGIAVYNRLIRSAGFDVIQL